MERNVPLSTGLGEVMAPGTLVAAMWLSPDGALTVDPGLLHGRSELEQMVRMAARREELAAAQRYWTVWVAVELDQTNQPARYTGVAVSELWIDPVNKLGYKVLAEQVNRMDEAMRGRINLKPLDQQERAAIGRRLAVLAPAAWERSEPAFRHELCA
jgi:hypothetical protein